MPCCAANGIYRAGDKVTWRQNNKEKYGTICQKAGDRQWYVLPQGAKNQKVMDERDLQLASSQNQDREGPTLVDSQTPQNHRKLSGGGRKRPHGRRQGSGGGRRNPRPRPGGRYLTTGYSDSDVSSRSRSRSRGSDSEQSGSESGAGRRRDRSRSRSRSRSKSNSSQRSASAQSRGLSIGSESEVFTHETNTRDFGDDESSDPGFMASLMNNFSAARLGTTGFAGVAAGYAMGYAIDNLILYVGLAICAFQLAVFKGWLGEDIQNLVYGNAKKAALALLDADGDGNIELSDLWSKMGQLKTILATGLTDAVGFGLGFMFGIRIGSDVLSNIF